MTCDSDMGGGMHATAKLKQAAAMADFTAYWHSMRRGTDVPHRSDIDPRGIEPLLTNAFIVERIAPGLARMRIAGSHLTDLMSMEVRGMPLSAFITPAHRDALSNHLVHLFDKPALLRLMLASPARAGAPGLTGEMLILPLRGDLGDISRALGYLVTDGNVGRGPRRFDITNAQVSPLEKIATDSLRPLGPAAQAVTGFSEARGVIDIENAPTRKGERPYLRLIKG